MRERISELCLWANGGMAKLLIVKRSRGFVLLVTHAAGHRAVCIFRVLGVFS